MRCGRRSCVPLGLALLLGALGGCQSTQYKNMAHPDYGDVEYKRDLTQCHSQNSQVYTHPGGYSDVTEVKVDEAKAASCMTDLGWQTVSR
jgi:hypothetical protein